MANRNLTAEGFITAGDNSISFDMLDESEKRKIKESIREYVQKRLSEYISLNPSEAEKILHIQKETDTF